MSEKNKALLFKKCLNIYDFILREAQAEYYSTCFEKSLIYSYLEKPQEYNPEHLKALLEKFLSVNKKSLELSNSFPKDKEKFYESM